MDEKSNKIAIAECVAGRGILRNHGRINNSPATGKGGSNTTAVEVDDPFTSAAREDNAPVKGIVTLRIEQAETLQEIEGISLSREMSAQASTRGITGPQFFDQGRITQSALPKITQWVGVAFELLLIQSVGLLQHDGRVGWKSAFLFEVSEAFAKGQMTGQLDKANEIAALAATVTVEEIFAGVDIERGAVFRMRGTESDELGAVSSRPGDPILLPQIIEQRQTLFQFLGILAHGAVLPLEVKRRRRRPAFPGKDGGQEKISQSRKGQLPDNGIKVRKLNRAEERGVSSARDIEEERARLRAEAQHGAHHSR
jgi:hypothetical protein